LGTGSEFRGSLFLPYPAGLMSLIFPVVLFTIISKLFLQGAVLSMQVIYTKPHNVETAHSKSATLETSKLQAGTLLRLILLGWFKSFGLYLWI